MAKADQIQEMVLQIPTKELKQARELARRRGVSTATILRQSLATERYLQEQVDDDVRILTRKGHGPLREVVFPSMKTRPETEEITNSDNEELLRPEDIAPVSF